MSLLTLPNEVQDEILFNLVLGYTGDYNITFMIRTEVLPYILSNRSALDCWRASRCLILRRVAKIRLPASDDSRRSLRRQTVLASLRKFVWLAAYEEYDDERYSNLFEDAHSAFATAWTAWNSAVITANFWRKCLNRSVGR
jgi:hypothetical protein